MSTSDRWRRIEEIFTAALDFPVEERNFYLQSACGKDDELRLEIQELLSREDDDGDAIGGIIQGAAANLFADEQPSPDAMLGVEIGNYKIVRELGRGGMGAVYLAERADRTFEKQVAIKVV